MQKEKIWRPSREGYEVSKLGHVRQRSRTDKSGKLRAARIITTMYRTNRSEAVRIKSKDGFVRLRDQNGNCSNVYVSELMAEAFFPEYDRSFHEVQFRDLDPRNVALDNLWLRARFATKLEKRLNSIARLSIQLDESGGNAHAS